MTTIYDHSAVLNNGKEISLNEYQGKVLLVVNTASNCGFTPQYEGLQNLYKEYSEQGFEVLAFPCNQFKNQEKGDSAEIKNFCDLNFNITFPLFQKIDVNGDNTHPLFAQLKDEARGIFWSTKVKWNFTKFLIGRDGKVIKRFATMTKPDAIRDEIEKQLNVEL